MRKLGSIAAVAAAVLVVALAAWTRQPAADGQGAATVTGKVKFTGAKPTNPPIDMSEEPKCKAKYTTTPTQETVVVNPNGTLANVFVYVKSGLPASAKYETPKTAVLIDQDGCHYRPHVLGIMVGQPLEIKNSDGILHNIKAKGVKNRPFNISQPTTMTSTRTFSAPEVMVPLECNVHGWMQATSASCPIPSTPSRARTVASRSRACRPGPTRSRPGTRSTGPRPRPSPSRGRRARRRTSRSPLSRGILCAGGCLRPHPRTPATSISCSR